MYSFVLSRKALILYVVLYTQRIYRSNHASSGRLQEDKDNGKIQNRYPKKWSRLLARGGRLRKFLAVVI